MLSGLKFQSLSWDRDNRIWNLQPVIINRCTTPKRHPMYIFKLYTTFKRSFISYKTCYTPLPFEVVKQCGIETQLTFHLEEIKCLYCSENGVVIQTEFEVRRYSRLKFHLFVETIFSTVETLLTKGLDT